MHSRLPLCVAVALTVAGMLSLAGCGVRGSLEAPPQAKTETGNATPGTPGQPTEPAQALHPRPADPLTGLPCIISATAAASSTRRT